MALQVSKNIQALAEAAEEKRRQQEQGFDPSVAGLGLGGGFVASQVGGQASTSSKLSPFAQQVAAADTARLKPPINPPKGNPILGRNVPTNPLNPSVGPMTKQPSLTAAQEAASQAARATAERGPSAMAKISQFVDNALSGASKFARSANIPSLLLAPNEMGDSTLTGNNIILSPFEQMAADNLALQEELAAPIANMPQQQQDIAPILEQLAAPKSLYDSIRATESNVQRGQQYQAGRTYLRADEDSPVDPLNPKPAPVREALENFPMTRYGGQSAYENPHTGLAARMLGEDGYKFYRPRGRQRYDSPEVFARKVALGAITQGPRENPDNFAANAKQAADRLVNAGNSMFAGGDAGAIGAPAMTPPSAAEAGDNLINIGNSLFPNEAPVNLMTPELRDQRAAERQRKYGDIEQNPNAIGRFVQDVLNTPKEMARRFDNFTGTLMRAATPEEELGYTPPSLGDVLATAGIRDAEGNIIGSGGRSEAITGPTRRPPATITATPADETDVTQRAMTEAMDGTAKTNAQRSELSPAQQNFLTRKEEGTPLKPDEIIAAQRYAVSQGQIFDPETGYSQAEFYGQRYKGQSIGDYLRGADTPQGATEQFVDPQGRLRRRMAGTDQLAPEYSSYERESAAREARLAARPDFMEAQPSQARKDGVMSMAQATKVAGGDKRKARSMIELQKMGRDPLTGQPEKPEGMTEYQTETLRQNQERIDLAKEEAEAARKAAAAAGATQAEKNAYDIAQRKVNLATTYQKFLEDKDRVFDAKDIEADLDSISDQLDIIYDPESGVFRRGKIWGEGEVIKLDDPKNASIVRTIGTYKVGKALLDKYPKKG
jgi:hypothetical protein